MRTRGRRLAALLALVLLSGACTGEVSIGPGAPAPAPPPVSPEPRPSQGTSRPGSAGAALARLCPNTRVSSPPAAQPAEGGPPAAIARIEREVESVTGLKFKTDVPVDPVTQHELAHRLQKSLQGSLPAAYLARRSQAWQTIGVVPRGTEIRAALVTFLTGSVIGYYEPTTGQLVFTGSQSPTPIEEVTLAHELTHAIDDQHFDLTRVDAIQHACHDEAGSATLATIEGSAVFFSLQVAQRHLSLGELGGLLSQS
ncbi:MAG: mitochondrial inner membrane protease ATP23, partial [Actinomycetota bacterium]|nr:mitochondrial inner membrane protease ATP23 [Actinomycetota bacterium]